MRYMLCKFLLPVLWMTSGFRITLAIDSNQRRCECLVQFSKWRYRGEVYRIRDCILFKICSWLLGSLLWLALYRNTDDNALSAGNGEQELDWRADVLPERVVSQAGRPWRFQRTSHTATIHRDNVLRSRLFSISCHDVTVLVYAETFSF